MPINEAAGFRKVGLNKEQRHAQEAAVYGVPVSTEQITLTHDEAERLRAMLAQHDRQSMPKQFDLNAPPKEPYRFQEFPCVIYDHEERVTKVVHSEEERAAYLAEGWRREAFGAELSEVALDPDEAAEVAKVDQLVHAKRGPGRPRKEPVTA
jgi:hypothetical protein